MTRLVSVMVDRYDKITFLELQNNCLFSALVRVPGPTCPNLEWRALRQARAVRLCQQRPREDQTAARRVHRCHFFAFNSQCNPTNSPKSHPLLASLQPNRQRFALRHQASQPFNKRSHQRNNRHLRRCGAPGSKQRRRHSWQSRIRNRVHFQC